MPFRQEHGKLKEMETQKETEATTSFGLTPSILLPLTQESIMWRGENSQRL